MTEQPALLFVCFANQCRSPLAEAVMRHIVREAKTGADWRIESAGTCATPGVPPHPHSVAVGRAHGVVVNGESRPLHHTDLFDFDRILVMDRRNLADLRNLAHGFGGESKARARIELLASYDKSPGAPPEVADPIGHDLPAYQRVYAQIEAACQGLWQNIRAPRG